MPVNTVRVQFIAIIGSLVFIFLIVELIRRKKIKESFSLLWLFFGVMLLVFSIWRKGLEYFAALAGIAYPPSALLLVFVAAVFFIMIQFSVILTKVSDQNKRLAQELSLLRHEIDTLKKSGTASTLGEDPR